VKKLCRATLLLAIASLTVPSATLFSSNTYAGGESQPGKPNKKKQKKQKSKRKQKILKGHRGKHKGKPA
jgi:hypothetical protein